MANKENQKSVTKHTEESVERIKSDRGDRERIRQYLEGIIDPFQPIQHPRDHLINIVSGEVADDKANPHEAVWKGSGYI